MVKRRNKILIEVTVCIVSYVHAIIYVFYCQECDVHGTIAYISNTYVMEEDINLPMFS